MFIAFCICRDTVDRFRVLISTILAPIVWHTTVEGLFFVVTIRLWCYIQFELHIRNESKFGQGHKIIGKVKIPLACNWWALAKIYRAMKYVSDIIAEFASHTLITCKCIPTYGNRKIPLHCNIVYILVQKQSELLQCQHVVNIDLQFCELYYEVFWYEHVQFHDISLVL